MPDFFNDRLNGEKFEASVRDVARQLYRNAHAMGSIKLEGRERDEIIDTGTELIVVEATQSRKLQKTKYDLEKSTELVRALKKDIRFSEYNFRIILITSEEPTADQNEYVRSIKSGCPKEIISFTSLFSRLFDAKTYIRFRGDHYFGSVRDPANEDNHNVPQQDYIPTALSMSNSGAAFKACDLASEISSGGRYVIYGEYGSGKHDAKRYIF